MSEIKQLVDQIYDRHCAGCCLHITLDDGSVDDDHLDLCLKVAHENQHSD